MCSGVQNDAFDEGRAWQRLQCVTLVLSDSKRIGFWITRHAEMPLDPRCPQVAPIYRPNVSEQN